MTEDMISYFTKYTTQINPLIRLLSSLTFRC